MARASLAAIAVVAAVAAGCGSSKPPPVQLEGGTESTGGKAIVLNATTEQKLAFEQGGVYALELRGIDKGASDASFDRVRAQRRRHAENTESELHEIHVLSRYFGNCALRLNSEQP